MASLLRFQVKSVAQCLQLARRSLSSSSQKRHLLQEPPYLDAEETEIPDYSLVNLQIKGYDFTVLEHYGKWVHSIAFSMGIDVEDGWATPCKKLHIQTLKPRSNKVEADYYLQIYERNLQLADVPSTMTPMFVEVVQAGLPEGVELSFHDHQPEYTEVRYIPDLELRGLYTQLQDLGGPSKK